MTMLHVDLCVIGAGSGGLSTAAVAVQMGASVALVEAGKMGGDCLNYGCVPSKSLLAAARRAQDMREAEQFGLSAMEVSVDFSKVMAHVHGVIQTLSANDSVERFTKLGVQVIQKPGTFKDSRTLLAGDTIIKARRFVIATGSSPAIPPIPGLEKVPFYTNETIFDVIKKPEHLIVIGGGPIGCELAQAFLLLGTRVTLLEAFNILPRDEEDLVGVLREELIKNGLTLHERVKITQVNQREGQIDIVFEKEGQQQIVTGSDLLVATGRQANIQGLNLEAAGVCYSKKGIDVNASLRTSNKYIYAIGDVVGPYQFTHMANYHAGIVIKNILFRWPAKVNYYAVPWVTYTGPELAHVGLSSREALKQFPDARVLTWDFTENDRAQAEHRTRGKIKVVTTAKGKILGVSLLGPHAGELLLPWILAVQDKKHIRTMTDVIVPYPTLSEISKRVAGEFYTSLLFSNRIRKLVRFLRIFG